MANIRDILPEVRATLILDQHLSDLSRRCTELSEDDIALDYLIAKALCLPPTTSMLTSLDTSLAFLRSRFPGWKYGFQDGGYKVWTGPTAWMNNGECQKTGFDNKVNLEHRYFERSAQKIEYAFAALILHACSYRRRDEDALLNAA
jgi:hypothetical protein